MASGEGNRTACASAKSNRIVVVLCGILLILVVAAIVVATVVGGVLGTAAFRRTNSPSDTSSDSNIATNFYSPGDSRLLSLPSFFCEYATLRLFSDSVDAELFIVDSAPPLNDVNNFTVTRNSTLNPSDFLFWQYYLYPNSNLTLSVNTSGVIDIYIVKGNENANRWASSPRADVAERFFLEVPSISDVLYTVQKEDEYYVIVHNSNDSIDLSFAAAFAYERFEYTTPADPIDSCLVNNTRGDCSVGIPYGLGSQNILVTISIPENGDYEENVGVLVDCEQRAVAYGIIVLVSFVVIIAVCVLGSVCLIYLRKKRYEHV